MTLTARGEFQSPAVSFKNRFCIRISFCTSEISPMFRDVYKICRFGNWHVVVKRKYNLGQFQLGRVKSEKMQGGQLVAAVTCEYFATSGIQLCAVAFWLLPDA